MEIFVGSTGQNQTVQVDTGSNKLLLMSSACTACQYTFNSSLSTTYNQSSSADYIAYLSGQYAFGMKAYDTVTLLDDTEVTGFNLLLANIESGFETRGGILGMTRSTDTSYNMLFNVLYEQGQTTSSAFALYLASTAYTSTMQLGGYDVSYLKEPAKGMMWIPLCDQSLFWDIKIDAFKVGSSAKGLHANGY